MFGRAFGANSQPGGLVVIFLELSDDQFAALAKLLDVDVHAPDAVELILGSLADRACWLTDAERLPALGTPPS